MEVKNISKTCDLCGDEANGQINNGDRRIELCNHCAKTVLWELIHNTYAFEED